MGVQRVGDWALEAVARGANGGSFVQGRLPGLENTCKPKRAER